MSLVAMVFLAVLIIICGAYWAFVARPERQAQKRLKRRLRGEHTVERTRQHSVLKSDAKDSSKLDWLESAVDRAGERLQPVRRLQSLIDQSGMPMSVSKLVLISGCLLLFTMLLVLAFSARPLVGLAAGALAALLPVIYVHRVRTKRLMKFEEHFPEAIDLIARSLRAGHAFPTGLGMVAEEVVKPVSTEFKIVYEQQNYGIPMSDALRALAERVPIIDVRFFVTAVLTQREAGGNLAEVLDNLSGVIRERFKIKRQVRVLSAHGRMTGWILAGLPPALAFAFMITVPTHLETLLNDPLGLRMIGGALVLQVLGTLIIRRIVDVEY